MTFTVTHDPANFAACLTHVGPVDAEEILASRQELREVAVSRSVRGVLINISDATITAEPVQIIDNVQGLVDELAPGTKLAFVSKAADQETVSMIVATVAHSSGRKVGQFHELEKALGWIRLDWDAAVAAGFVPIAN
ncbi:MULTISPECIES: hypothetical protein [Maricaulis]|jgi:hypothetical protein|uniref:SpoIIAA-like protein n=1 Tax=Maricaulis maris (strain MCS10) TaxID=394221 RepID=Q0ALV9_MARMM|nr:MULTISPECIES: hypothetical protein [Maricaulis]ABI66734.1 hypothetical protein Mmar10_2442 [Maricaulis maris MCS10]MAC90580.1 hypothetical protein [Maricaulis sp.]